MAIANLVVKVSGQMADLEADLKKTNVLLGDFGKNFDTVSIKASKAQEALNKSFSGEKIITQAAQIVSAVEKIGGASKLTADEQDKVNKTVSAAIDKYAALGQTAPAAMLALAQATEKVPNTKVNDFFDDLGKHIVATAAGFVTAQAVIGGVERAFDGLTEFVKGSIDSFAESEAASRRLSVALQTQGLNIPNLVNDYKDLSEAYQRNTAFSNDAIVSAEALFVQLGNVGPDQMDKALQAATDLSAGLGVDLDSSVRLVAKAFEGNTTSLKRYGIVLDEARVKGEGMGYVLDTIESKVGGQAQAELDTYAGKIKQIGNAWDDVKKSIGQAIVTDPNVLAFLKSLQAEITKTGQDAQTYTPTVTDWFVAIATNGDVIAQDVIRYVNIIRSGLAAVDEAFAHPPALPGFGVPSGDPFAGLKADAKDFADQTVKSWEDADRAAQEAARQHAAAIQQIQDSLTHADLTRHAKDLAEAFSRLAPEQKTLDMVKRLGDEAADIIVKGGHVPQLLQDIALATGAIHDPALAAETDFKNIGRTLTDEVNPAAKETAKRLLEIFNPNRVGLDGMFKDIGTGIKSDGQIAKDVLDEIKKHQDDVLARQKEWLQAVRDIGQEFTQLGQIVGGTFGKILQEIGHVISAIGTTIRTIESLSRTIGTLSSGNGGGFSSLLGLGRGAAGLFGVGGTTLSAGDISAQIASTGAGVDALSTGGTASTGGFASSALGGAAITAGGISGLYALYSYFAGRDEKFFREQEARKAQQEGDINALLKQYGGTTGLSNAVTSVGLNPTSILGGQFNGGGISDAQLQQLEKNIAEFQSRMEALQADVQRFGLTFEDLLPPQQIQQITAGAGTIEDSFTRLTTAGYDESAVLRQMAPDINDWLSHALDAGAKIPPAMQPILDKLIEMGGLTDDNARKLLGLSTVKLDGGSFDDIVAAAQRYGITIDALGPKVNQIDINQTATQLANDFKLLTSDGEDVNVVLDHMKGAAQKVVDQALKFGDTIPDSMRPLLQALVDAGELTDQNGTKLKDLSGIHFEKPLTSAIDDLITKIGELIDTISGPGGLGPSLDGLPKHTDIHVTTHYDTTGTPPDTGGYTPPAVPGVATGGYVLPHGIMRFAGGGYVPMGTDTVPAMLTPGELILNATQQADLSRSLRKRAGVTIINQISAVDGASVQRVVSSREFSESLVRAFKLNLNGIAEALN